MRFNKHLDLAGSHAYLSPSKYHWMNYDEDKFDRVYSAFLAARKGDELHDLASKLIKAGIRLPAEPATTMSLYVNDAIGYRMAAEQTLFYSEHCYGTADAISFRQNVLRIHDLKTGYTPTSVHQLEGYAALFCIEYGYRPFDIEIELRIYQSNGVQVFEADPDVIFHIMERIVTFDARIREIREEAQL